MFGLERVGEIFYQIYHQEVGRRRVRALLGEIVKLFIVWDSLNQIMLLISVMLPSCSLPKVQFNTK